MAPAAPAPASARRRAAAPAPAASTRRRAEPAPAASTRRRAPTPAPAASSTRRRAAAPAPAAAATRRRAPAPAPAATPRQPPPTPPTPSTGGFSETGDTPPPPPETEAPPPPEPSPPPPAPRRRATAPAAVGDAYATPFLRQLAGRTWVERVATPERPGRLESVDELSPILSRHTENNVSEDPHAGLDEDQLAAAVAGLAAPSLRPRRAASWSAGDLSMTFNEQRRRWEGGPQVDLSGFGDDVNPRRTSKSADDAKEDAIAQEELEATLVAAEKRRDGELQRFWGGAPADNGDNDAATWLRSGDAAKALGALPEEAPAPAPARRKSPAKGAAELELFKEIQHGRGDEDNDGYDPDNYVALSGSKLVAATRQTPWDLETGGRPGQVALFDAWTGIKLRDVFRCDYDVIRSVALSETTLALSGFGDGVVLFDAATGERQREFGSKGWALDFSPDGTKLAVGEEDATTVYDVATGEVLSEFVHGCVMSENNFISRGVDCSKYAKATPGSWESCSADCLANPACIGLQTDSPWDDCEMVLEESVEDCPTEEGGFTFYPKDCSSRAPGRPGVNPVSSVAFSPDGKLLATGGRDGKIRIYNVETEEQRVEIEVGGWQETLAWAPDSSVLAAASPAVDDGFTAVPRGAATYDATTGSVMKTFEIEGIDYVAFSPDGATLVASGGYYFNDESKVVIFDATSGDVKQTIDKGGMEIFGLDYSPDGTLALGEEGKVSLYREAGAPVPSTPAPTAVPLVYAQVAEIPRTNGGGALPKKIAFSPDGNIAVGDAWPVVIYDGFTGRVVREVTDREDGSIDTVAFSPDGKTLAVGLGGFDVRRLSLYDAETGDLRKEIPFDCLVRVARFSPDGSTLAVGGGCTSNGAVGYVTIFDAASLDVLAELDMGDRPWVSIVAYSPAGSELAVKSGWGSLDIYAASSGELLQTLSAGSLDPQTSPIIYDVAFAYDATLAMIRKETLYSEEDPTVVFFDESFEESGELTPDGRASTLAFSPRADGLLAVGGAKVWLFDYASKTLVREFERCSPFVDEMAFSQDGALLAVAAGSTSDYPNGRVALYLRSPDDAPVPRPTPRPTSRPTFRPTSSPRDESDGARTASMAWTALLLVALLA